jgi:hypothetical protein
MKRLRCVLGAGAVAVAALTSDGRAADRFDIILTVDRQIVHVLNRLTFGPRPGDAEEVRRLGVEQWIDLQLHPERIPENPVLENRLEPMQTLELATWQILEKYAQNPLVPSTLPADRVQAP